jgi:mannose-6-phosphate isomerase-like protein (cupin superfamily)
MLIIVSFPEVHHVDQVSHRRSQSFHRDLAHLEPCIQHLIFTQGKCKAIIAGEEKIVQAGDLVIVPQGTEHNCMSHRIMASIWLTGLAILQLSTSGMRN